MTQPTQTFNFTLDLDTTNLVLNALSKLPYEQVINVINSIQQQAQAQLQPAPTAPEPAAPSAPVAPVEVPATPTPTQTVTDVLASEVAVS